MTRVAITTATIGRPNRRARSEASNATATTPSANCTSCKLMESGIGDQASTAPMVRFHTGG